MDAHEQLILLLNKLQDLKKQQDVFGKEVQNLQNELNRLKDSVIQSEIDKSVEKDLESVENIELVKTIETEEYNEVEKERQLDTPSEIPTASIENLHPKPAVKKDWEKLIGESWLSRIGIIVTIIGVVIGVKYSIENNLLNPLSRIILGYTTASILLVFGVKLKKNYFNYSAVLVSGAITILYFITYSAYHYYHLIPQLPAFGLMVLFTGFAVYAATHYNKQLIAHLGLVGAYAIPFLLSNNSGKPLVLLSYVAIINIGILVISIKKTWKPLLISAFALTWIIYTSWLATRFFGHTDPLNKQFVLAFFFLFVNFITFYAALIINKLRSRSSLALYEIILTIINALIFFGIGCFLLGDKYESKEALSIFAITNALIHFVVGLFFFKRKHSDTKYFYLIAGLVLVFLTISIPIQLDGNWVTLFWIGEALILFWIGRAKQTPLYEYLSYPLILLSIISLVQDWESFHHLSSTRLANFKPILNYQFFTSIILCSALAYMYRICKRHQKKNNLIPIKDALFFGSIALFYLTGMNEIESIYYSKINGIGEGTFYLKHYADLNSFKYIWYINYTLIFLISISVINLKFIKKRKFTSLNLLLNAIGLSFFLFLALYHISELRDNYLDGLRQSGEYLLRYFSLILAGSLLFLSYLLSQLEAISSDRRKLIEIVMHVVIVWILSSELIHWIHLSEMTNVYKIWLSILWAAYSLFLISRGIVKRKKYLRVLAISFFALTLAKLIMYDLNNLSTISKTIVFLSVGALLLISSFLYNKFNFDEN